MIRPTFGAAASRLGRPDVLVVGAGPAGSSLAWRLASSGVAVSLLDAGSFPRSKPCGDAISPGATPILREMGVEGALRRTGASVLRGWRIRAPSGRWFEGRFEARDTRAPAHGYAIARSELDARLLDAALAAGVHFLPRARAFGLLGGADRIEGVRIRTGDGAIRELRARLVVGADGLRSVVARRLGGVRHGPRARLAMVGRFADVPVGGGLGTMRVSREGCLGMAPIGEGRCNVTLVVPLGAARWISRDRWSFYRDRLRSYGVWQQLGGGRLTEQLQVTGPFEIAPGRLTDPGALLTGDAAGYFDPFTGQGVFRALWTARLAAEATLALLERPAEEPARLEEYELRLRRFLRPGRIVQRLIDRAITTPVLLEAFGRLLRGSPGLADLLVDVTGDRLRPSSLLEPGRLWDASLSGRPVSSPPAACDRGGAISRGSHAHVQ